MYSCIRDVESIIYDKLNYINKLTKLRHINFEINVF